METIRKKICTDKLLSHRNGLVPYIKKDDEDTEIKYVSTVSSESNYGSFPCDFTIIDSHMVFDKESGISYRENVEVSRLRYLDVISMYSKCNDIVKNGIVLKKIPYAENPNPCGPTENEQEISDSPDRGETPPTPEPIIEPCDTNCAWVEDENVSIFNCELVDSSFFVKNDSGVYFINEDVFSRYNELTQRYGINLDDYIELATEEEKLFAEHYLHFIGTENDGVVYCKKYLLIVDGYDEYVKSEKKWNNWWETNWELCSFNVFYSRWEQYIFDAQYHQPASLKFIYDVEKYVLGKVSVPENYGGREINGAKVPDYVFYLNYMDYLRWFGENAQYLDSNDTLRKEWEKRGGVGFKNFLFSISPVFFRENLNPTNGDVVYFTFTSPNIEIPIVFCNEFYNETSYQPYEYSVIDNNIVNGTIEYQKGQNGCVESALTPNFAKFGGLDEEETDFVMFDDSVFVESKLESLTCNDVYYVNKDISGVFNTFSGGGCLFKCTFFTGYSTQVDQYTSGCVKYYAKTSNNNWNEVKSIKIPEKYSSTISSEEMPKTHLNAYQVVGITYVSSSFTVTTQQSNSTPPSYQDEGKLKIVSSVTTYNKTIRRKYSWCECEKVQSATNIKCGDGENIDFNGASKYRNILLLSCAPSASERKNSGDFYYYMVKYDNGYTNIGRNKEINKKTSYAKSLSLPYIVGQQINVESYSGEFSDTKKYDMVTNIDIADDMIVIDYVIGATVGDDIEKSGIHYEDTYNYYGNVIIKTVVDGVYDAEILYEKTGLSTQRRVYSEDVNAYRVCNIAEIFGMEVGTQWTNESSVRAYLFTDDMFDNLMEYPKIMVDISYNRGNAAAWEKHFKLSECNTFEDLENYGNNYFNL